MKAFWINRYVSLIILMALLGGCAVNPATGERDFVLMSENEELALGRQYSKQVMKEYRAYDNPALQRYVQSVGDRVAKVSHRKNLIYRFTLLDSNQVNAFALPGGYIYITRGLLVYLNSEAELAAVLGHELGHVTARHSVRQHSLSTTTNLLGGLVAAASGVRGVGQLTHLLSTGIIRGYGREHELEADGLGVDYLVTAGYSSSAMKKVISILKNQEVFDRQLALEQGREPRAYHGVFSTHPDNDTRLQQVLSRVGQQESAKIQDTKFLKRLVGLTFGSSEEEGVIRGNTFYHLKLNFKMTFPTDWLIANRPNSVDASAPRNAAFMQLMLKDPNKKLTPKQFLKTRLGVEQAITEAPLMVGELRGHTAVVVGKTPYGQGKLRVAVLFEGLKAFVFYSAAKQTKDFIRYDQHVLNSIKSFSKLNRKDQLVAKELSIKVTMVERSRRNMKTLAKGSPISRQAEAQLRLLNDFFPAGEPKLGDLIKIVR